MLSASPVNSPDQHPYVLIAALSGRALAELACKAGYRPLVADLFGDVDTRRHAEALRVTRGSLMQGPDPDDLIAVLSDLAQLAEEPPIGLVCGAGFEQRPEILDDLASGWPLLGCSADVVRRAKDPTFLARLCAELDIPHPMIRFDVPADPECWLAKRVGGSGGWHISNARSAREARGVYFQRRAPGEPVCALMVGTGKNAGVIGWSSQWTSPISDVPYRWAGAVQPARMEPALQALLSRKAIELVVAAGIVGIASLDFLIDSSTWHLLEINPRPGGTLDIFDDGSGSLFEVHIQACRGRLIEPPHYRGAQASTIVFAERDIEGMPDLQWPDWCADLQRTGTRVEAGAPVCTVRGAADDPQTARRLVGDRRRMLLLKVHEAELAAC
jgi:predicted ATP-grasp superfamily ATP-dependent carboligase